jgi:SAM-dependent methyltransferase
LLRHEVVGCDALLNFWHAVGNRLLTLLSNAFTDLNLTDMETCYKLMVRDVAWRLDLQSKDFGVEPEITCKIARMRARVYEVPIAYHGRTYEEGKKIGLKDAFKAAYTIVRYSRWEAPKDDIGAITLRRMTRLQEYNRWLHDRFDAYLGRRILEVGSGVGNQTRYFADRERVIASDIEPHYVRELLARFEGRPNVRVASFRFPLSERQRADLHDEQVDSIVCMNVLEHIEDDEATLRDFASILERGDDSGPPPCRPRQTSSLRGERCSKQSWPRHRSQYPDRSRGLYLRGRDVDGATGGRRRCWSGRRDCRVGGGNAPAGSVRTARCLLASLPDSQRTGSAPSAGGGVHWPALPTETERG